MAKYPALQSLKDNDNLDFFASAEGVWIRSHDEGLSTFLDANEIVQVAKELQAFAVEGVCKARQLNDCLPEVPKLCWRVLVSPGSFSLFLERNPPEYFNYPLDATNSTLVHICGSDDGSLELFSRQLWAGPVVFPLSTGLADCLKAVKEWAEVGIELEQFIEGFGQRSSLLLSHNGVQLDVPVGKGFPIGLRNLRVSAGGCFSRNPKYWTIAFKGGNGVYDSSLILDSIKEVKEYMSDLLTHSNPIDRFDELQDLHSRK
jgi:hypothetical protein